KQLKPKLTTGRDKIPAFIVRDCKFPSQRKTSRICPVYKKGEKSEINNY
ncbi:unnamed protein product, partial [Tenebrio molitor]